MDEQQPAGGGEQHRMGDELVAVIAAQGGELQSVRTAGGHELLWQAGPQWPRHAPVLFPIVGRLAGDTLLHDGVAYRMTQHGFARDRRFREGLLRQASEPTPIRGRHLALDEALFADDAVILEAPASHSLRYGVPDGPALLIGWNGFSQLGLWAKPGTGFLCIEPWSGLASPEGFDGEFRLKPHLMLIPPGETRQASWSLTLGALA